MDVDEALVQAARAELDRRFPGVGGIAAAGYLRSGRLIVGVMFVPEWGGGGLCAETEVILLANRADEPLDAIVCVSRPSQSNESHVIAPCGICQERLFHWGGATQVGVPAPDRPSGWQSLPLSNLQPHYWAGPLMNAQPPP